MSKLYLVLAVFPIQFLLYSKSTGKVISRITISQANNSDTCPRPTKGLYYGFRLTGFRNGSEVLHSDKESLIIGVNNQPYYLEATPQFNPYVLPDTLERSIFKLQSILLYEGFLAKVKTQSVFYTIPLWISEEKDLKLLKLQSFKLTNLSSIKQLPIEHLILINILIVDRAKVLEDLSEMKKLKYLVQNNLFKSSEVAKLKSKLPDLVVFSEIDYRKKIKNNEINIQL